MPVRRASWLVGVALAFLFCVAGQAGAAAAASSSAAGAAKAKMAITSTLGGYVVSGKGAASAAFAVPRPACPRTSIGTVSVGVAAAQIGGNSAEAVVSITCQAPSPPVLVGEVISYCSGHATKTKTFPVVAGNKMVLTAGSTGAATVDDTSRNATTTVSGCAVSMNKAVFGLFCPGDWTIPYPPPTGTPACTTVPGVSKLAFSATTLGGKPVKTSASTPYELQVGKSTVTPGKLSSKGNFTDTYK